MVLAKPGGQLLVKLTNFVLDADKLSKPRQSALAPFLAVLGLSDARLKSVRSVAVLEENRHVFLAPFGNEAVCRVACLKGPHARVQRDHAVFIRLRSLVLTPYRNLARNAKIIVTQSDHDNPEVVFNGFWYRLGRFDLALPKEVGVSAPSPAPVSSANLQ
jgi:hypothetical protein